MFIPLVFSCSVSDEVSKIAEIKGQYILPPIYLLQALLEN